MKKIKLAVLPGDGVGQDLIVACMPIFAALNVPLDVTFADIGFDTWQETGEALSLPNLTLIKNNDAVLIGAIKKTPRKRNFKNDSSLKQVSKPRYISPIPKLNKALEIFGCVKSGKMNLNNLTVNCTIIQKNIPETRSVNGNIHTSSCSHQSKKNWVTEYTKLFELAFNYAERKKISSIFLNNEVESSTQHLLNNVASKYPNIKCQFFDKHNILNSIKENNENLVIVRSNFQSQTLLDKYFSASANYGLHGCYFKPIHGSEPHLKPYSINPISMFLSIGLLLEHFEYQLESYCIKAGINNILGKRHSTIFSGKYFTLDLANAIIHEAVNFREIGFKKSK